MINRNYPLSSHYFPNLIENDAIYVDKTQFIVPLLANKNNATYFLSRPRRFGKSLFMSALGVRMNVEVSTQEGRIDAVVETNTHIYIFEFKKKTDAPK